MNKLIVKSDIESSSVIRKLMLLLPILLLMGCSDWEVRNQRIQPTYVCEGDSAHPVATWDYSGPKAKVKITTCNNEVLCTSGARQGYCAFDRALTVSDLPLKVKVYKKNDLKDTKNIFYEVLSGTEATEEFIGTLNWSDPYETTIEEKRPVYDNLGNPTKEVEVVTYTAKVKSANQVRWDIPSNWFTSRVIVESVKYTLGNKGLDIEGPGITRTHFYVGQKRPGNGNHPGGTWFGHFEPPIEVKIDDIDIHTYGLKLFIRCSE